MATFGEFADMATLHDVAYAAMERGALADASRHFGTLLRHRPDDRYYQYMRGLAHKYMLDWPTSLEHNLAAIAASPELDEAHHWNAAMAATAIGDWTQARLLWSRCGIALPDGEGPIEADFGEAVIRLHPWRGGETVFAQRIDPVRARILNVPLPESGHRFGDIVLHDGAATGYRFGHDNRRVTVFNGLVRLQPSDFRTFVVFVTCHGRDDLQPLLEATLPGIGLVEDWTSTVHHYCMRCSYGAPHAHVSAGDVTWQPQRSLGIAAQGRTPVEQLLKNWTSSGADRIIDGIENREYDVPEREDGHVWWHDPEDTASGE